MAVGSMSNYAFLMMKTFSQSFNEHLEVCDCDIVKISEQTGVKKDALYKLKSGKTQNMNVRDAIKVARYFDKSVEQFMGIEIRQVAEDRFQQLSSQLSDQERQILAASINAIVASRADSDSEPAPDAQSDG